MTNRSAWLLANQHALRYLQVSHDRADRDAAMELFREVERGGDDELRAAARMWLGLLGVFGVFPDHALGPLTELAAGPGPRRVTDFASLRELAGVDLGVEGRPEVTAELEQAVAHLGAAQAGLPGPLPGFVAGLRGLAKLMLGRPGAADDLAAAVRQWGDEPGAAEIRGLSVLTRLKETPGSRPATAEPPFGQVLRTLILAELGLGTPVGGATDHCGDQLRQAAGALVGGTAPRLARESVDRAVQLARRVLDHPAGPGGAHDRFLLGLALTMRAAGTTGHDDQTAAIDELRAAATELPAGDPLAPIVRGTLGSVLMDRYQAHGSLADLDAAVDFLRASCRAYLRQSPADPAGGDVRALLGAATALRGIRLGDDPELDRATVILREARERLHPATVGRARAGSALGLALFASGALRHDLDRIGEGAELIGDAAANLPGDHAERPALTIRGGLAHVVRALLTGDPEERRLRAGRGIELLRRGLSHRGLRDWEAGRLRSGLGLGHLIRAELGSPADLDAAIDHYEAACRLAAGVAEAAAAGSGTLRRLSEAYRRRDGGAGADRARAVEAGLGELRAAVDELVPRPADEQVLRAAAGVAERAGQVAGWCLHDGTPARAVEALELGRGLVLHLATAGTDVPGRLRGRGHHELADEWAGVRGPGPWTAEVAEVLAWEPPNAVRLRVRAVLRPTGPPALDDLAAALTATGTDALVYLVPGATPGRSADETGGPGHAVLVRPDRSLAVLPLSGLVTGPGSAVAAYEQAVRARDSGFAAALDAVTAWAWTSTIGPLLECVADRGPAARPRLALVPYGPLGLVPWHAAGVGDDSVRRLAVVSYAATGRQLVDAAALLHQDS